MSKIKDKKNRYCLQQNENQKFILKCILKSLNFSMLIRWSAFVKLKFLNKSTARSKLNRVCLQGKTKRFNYLTTFSRHIFLNLLRSGMVAGLAKANW